MSASSVQWIQIVVADIQNSRSGPLVLGFQTTALAAGQTDPIPSIIVQVTEEILGVMGFSGKYTMDASYGAISPNVIPPNLKDWAVEKICRRLKMRLNMALLAQEQEDERQYERRLNLLRQGQWPVDVTNNPGNNLSRPTSGIGNYNRQSPQFTRCQLNNL